MSGAPTLAHPGLGQLVVVAVAPERTYALRQQVLRPHQRPEEMGFVETGHPDELVVGAVTRSGEVVATGVVAPGAPPRALEALVGPGSSWRLRGMATRLDVAGSGIGAAVLAALVDHVAAHGGGLVWCNARVPARRFYERAGLETFGDVWVEPEIGPHVVMWRRVHG